MKYAVRFQPNDVAISVDEGANLLDAALAADVHIDASCGGQGACGNCRVKVLDGEVDSEPSQHLTKEDVAKGLVLACCTSVVGDCTIEIPAEALPPKGEVFRKVEMGYRERRVAALDDVSIAGRRSSAPLAVKVPMQLSAPTLQDNVSDTSRLKAGLKQHGFENVLFPVRSVHGLPQLLRAHDWQVTPTLWVDPSCPVNSLNHSGENGDRFLWTLVGVEGGDTSSENLGLAIDVGTTTVCGQLVDYSTGKVLAETAVYNQQIPFGADVITRIVFAQKSDGAQKLQSAVLSTINEVVDRLLHEANRSRKSISSVVAAGNTTMTHLLLGLETRYIREAPYVPAASSLLVENARAVGVSLSEETSLCVFPSVASYVGGDIVAGILGSGIFEKEELTLYMDIGTNGEIVLGNRDWLACAACSMGPAFEGGGIRHGMRAETGAIEGFHVNPKSLEPMILTVGRKKPRGICGSGLISVLSELLSAGIIDPKGKFHGNLSSDRIREGRYGYEYVLAWEEHTATEEDIVISEVDIDNLIRAKGALFAGCLTLLDSLSLSFDDLDRVIIAGAFGRYINLEKGQRIGLFPDIPVEKFQFLGNGSLMGAAMVSLDRTLFRQVERIGRMMTNVELSDNSLFMDKYMASLFLPHTEKKLFPNVSKFLEQRVDITNIEGEE